MGQYRGSAILKTKARGIHATFSTDCVRCGGEITVSNGRPDRHQCEPPRPTLADLEAIEWPPPMVG